MKDNLYSKSFIFRSVSTMRSKSLRHKTDPTKRASDFTQNLFSFSCRSHICASSLTIMWGFAVSAIISAAGYILTNTYLVHLFYFYLCKVWNMLQCRSAPWPGINPFPAMKGQHLNSLELQEVPYPANLFILKVVVIRFFPVSRVIILRICAHIQLQAAFSNCKQIEQSHLFQEIW